MCNSFMIRWSCKHLSECRRSTCRGTHPCNPASSGTHRHRCKSINLDTACKLRVARPCATCEVKAVRKHWTDEIKARRDAVEHSDRVLRVALKSRTPSRALELRARRQLHKAVLDRDVCSDLRDVALIDVRFLPSKKLCRAPKDGVKISRGSPLKREIRPEDLDVVGRGDEAPVSGPDAATAAAAAAAAQTPNEEGYNLFEGLPSRAYAPLTRKDMFNETAHSYEHLDQNEEYYVKLQAELMNMSAEALATNKNDVDRTLTEQSSGAVRSPPDGHPATATPLLSGSRTLEPTRSPPILQHPQVVVEPDSPQPAPEHHLDAPAESGPPQVVRPAISPRSPVGALRNRVRHARHDLFRPY